MRTRYFHYLNHTTVVILCPKGGCCTQLHSIKCTFSQILPHCGTSFFLVTFQLWRQNLEQKTREKTMMKLTAGVNFINVFTYEFFVWILFRQLFLLTFWLWQKICTKNVPVNRWWNWRQVTKIKVSVRGHSNNTWHSRQSVNCIGKYLFYIQYTRCILIIFNIIIFYTNLFSPCKLSSIVSQFLIDCLFNLIQFSKPPGYAQM